MMPSTLCCEIPQQSFLFYSQLSLPSGSTHLGQKALETAGSVWSRSGNLPVTGSILSAKPLSLGNPPAL